MKPQCNTSAECLRELARVMEQFGFADVITALNSKYVKEASGWSPTEVPRFSRPEDWQFAIAEVEGKPVFVGDALYTDNGKKFVAGEMNDGFLCGIGYKERGMGLSILPKWCSWNPPRPATVLVELTVEDAEFYASETGWGCSKHTREACKKALEKLK